MSEQTPTNLSNADFTFKDKYGNTGKTKGVSANDSTKLNNMVKLMNLMLNTPNSTDFINTLATKQYVDENQSSGLNLFDVVAKDHVLTYGEDLEGFAPLGTWVYKDAVDGSRYGYPDFVQKCLDEYDEATDDLIPYNKFEQPVLSANGTLGGDSFAVSADSEYSSTYAAYKAFDNTTSTLWVAADSNYPKNIIFYNPTPLLVKKLTLTSRDTLCTVTDGIIYGSNDNSNWVQIVEFTNTNTNPSESWDIDLSSNISLYKYYKIHITGSRAISGTNIGLSEVKIFAYENSIPVKRHSNGHIFFDVADIDKVNTYFNTYGHAWFYGIDETNERVFLPRQAHGKLIESYKNGTEWYRVYEDGWCEQGGRIPASNDGEYHSGTISLLKPFTDSNYNCFITNSGNDGDSYALIQTNRTNSTFSYGHVITRYGADWIALGYISLANVEVTPSYEYMVVGNVKVEQASTEVIDVTTTNNDTVPLFAPHYFDYTPNNLSWLKGGEQFNSGDLYKTCYNELVNVLNGETKYGSLKVIDQADMVSGTDYSLYWIVDQVNETFRTPTKTQQRFVVKTWQNGSDWYRIYNDGWCEQGGVIEKVEGSNVLVSKSLHLPYLDTNYQVYCLIADGSSGSDITYTQYRSYAYDQSSFKYVAFNQISRYWRAYGYIDLSNTNLDVSLYFKVANAVENIQMLNVGEVTEALTSKADTDLSNVPSSKGILVESYHNGTSWYRVYSDGWCEQGGQTNGNYVVVNLLKPFIDMNYTLETLALTDSNATADAWHIGFFCGVKLSNSQIKIGTSGSWFACGYIS